MASRLTYGMSRQGIVPRVFGAVHAGRRTPLAAIVFTTVLAMILISTGDLSDLADTTVLLLLVVFIFVNVSVLVLRRDRVDHAHFRAPTALPVIGIVVCIALMTEKTGETYLRAAILLAVGVAFWVVSRLITGPARMDTEQLEAVARPDAPPPSS
jgi:APA family basic amino acid/polyamine antiporter